jgi:serine/threonine protein kinase
MGEVYRARDQRLHRDVAIKVLPDLFADDPERLARLTREAQTLAALSHPTSPRSTPPASVDPDGVFSPVAVAAAVTPTSGSLRADEREALVHEVELVIETFVDTRGVGEPIVYNQLVTAIMIVAGVQDVILDVTRFGSTDTEGRQTLYPEPPNTRPRLDVIDVTLRGAPIALDVTVTVERKGLAAAADRATALHDIEGALQSVIPSVLPQLTDGITVAKLLASLPATDTYEVESVSYVAEFVDEGLRITKQDLEISPASDQVPWIRTVTVTETDSFGGDS